MADEHDYTVTAGDSDGWTLELTGEDAPADLTGWVLFFTAKEKKSDADADAVISKTVTTHADAANAITGYHLTPDDTRAIAETPYSKVYYDVQLVSPDGSEVDTLLRGEIRAEGDITQRTS